MNPRIIPYGIVGFIVLMLALNALDPAPSPPRPITTAEKQAEDRRAVCTSTMKSAECWYAQERERRRVASMQRFIDSGVLNQMHDAEP